jgi:hypothetical protein
VNEKKVQDPGSNPEPGARGIANPTERNGHPKTQVPKTGTWGTRLFAIDWTNGRGFFFRTNKR